MLGFLFEAQTKLTYKYKEYFARNCKYEFVF